MTLMPAAINLAVTELQLSRRVDGNCRCHLILKGTASHKASKALQDFAAVTEPIHVTKATSVLHLALSLAAPM